MATIFEKVKELGIQYSSNQSDLYIPKTKQTLALVEEFDKTHNTTNFWNNIKNAWWLDVAFAYDPFWEEKAKNEVITGTKKERKKRYSE